MYECWKFKNFSELLLLVRFTQSYLPNLEIARNNCLLNLAPVAQYRKKLMAWFEYIRRSHMVCHNINLSSRSSLTSFSYSKVLTIMKALTGNVVSRKVNDTTSNMIVSLSSPSTLDLFDVCLVLEARFLELLLSMSC